MGGAVAFSQPGKHQQKLKCRNPVTMVQVVTQFSYTLPCLHRPLAHASSNASASLGLCSCKRCLFLALLPQRCVNMEDTCCLQSRPFSGDQGKQRGIFSLKISCTYSTCRPQFCIYLRAYGGKPLRTSVGRSLCMCVRAFAGRGSCTFPSRYYR